MNNKLDVFITGAFTTVTPLTYSAPGVDGLPKIAGMPYIPSSAIRGKLRRAARDEVVEATGFRPGFDDFYFLTVGGLNTGEGKGSSKNGEGDNESRDEEEAAKAAKESYAIHFIRAVEKINPLVSLFGAGPGSPTAIPSKLYIGHAIAVAADAREITSKVSPCRTDDARIDAAHAYEIVSDEFFDQYLVHVTMQRAKSEAKKEQGKIKKSLSSAEGDERESLMRRLAEIDSFNKKANVVSISNPALAYDVINPGVRLPVSMRVMRCNENELSLLVKAFARFAGNPVFGARKAVGNGVVSGEFQFAIRPHKSLQKPDDIGGLAFEGDFLGLSSVTGQVREFLEKPLPYENLRFSYEALLGEGASK